MVNEIFKIVLGILVSVGGISGIILACIKFSCNIIAKRLEEKYSLKLSKELESYKSKLENKTYISKTKFDTEFNIYKELSSIFSEMVRNINFLIPIGISYKLNDVDAEKERQNNLYDTALNSTACAQNTLNKYIPFIPSKIFDSYNEILKLSSLQIRAFERRWNHSYIGTQQEKERFTPEEYNRTSEINTKFKILNDNIRIYLSELDVLE